jgi:uncharacterized membrane protein YeaQ/YmgE (transglycosylase-associated protein family)
VITLVLWFVVGAIVGALGAWLARPDNGAGLTSHIVAGIAAALACGLLVGPLVGVPIPHPLTFLLGGLGLSLTGAVAAAWLVQTLRERHASGATRT